MLKFCVWYGTGLKASTGSLLRDFNDKLLENAFKDLKKDINSRIKELRAKKVAFEKGEYVMSKEERDFVGDDPNDFADYIDRLIKQERQRYDDIRKNYGVFADTTIQGKKAQEIHEMMNPRVSFGYSNILHEEIDAELEKVRDIFLKKATFMDYGLIFFNSMRGLSYSDVCIEKDGKTIYFSTTHECMADLELDEEGEKAFIAYKKGNDLILKKLKSGVLPDFKEGESVNVTVNAHILAIKRDNEYIIFKGTQNNTKFLFNEGTLGGEYHVNEEGNIELAGANPTEFVNGGKYEIVAVDLCNGIHGPPQTGINTDGMYAALSVELKNEEGKYCDISMNSDKVTVEVD